MDKINLFGASGHAKVIIDILNAQQKPVGVLYDDNPKNLNINNIPVYVASEVPIKGPMLISIGSNMIRKLVSDRYNVEYTKAIHPSAIISDSSIIENGSVVMQGAIIQSDVKIGKHCIVNTGASIDHECTIKNYAHISPHATLCGNVKIGEGSWIGAGATIIPGIKIGDWCEIGAGAVVIHDVPDGAVVAGVPAKIIKFKAGYSQM